MQYAVRTGINRRKEFLERLHGVPVSVQGQVFPARLRIMEYYCLNKQYVNNLSHLIPIVFSVRIRSPNCARSKTFRFWAALF